MTAPTPRPAEEAHVLRTVEDLLHAIELLPETERVVARDRIDAALELDAPSCRAALGLLALDLAPVVRPTARDLEVRVHVLHLDAVPATASA